jgi:hypothetical protein
MKPSDFIAVFRSLSQLVLLLLICISLHQCNQPSSNNHQALMDYAGQEASGFIGKNSTSWTMKLLNEPGYRLPGIWKVGCC